MKGERTFHGMETKKTCEECGRKYVETFCCLMSPSKHGWCAWCGEPIDHRAFCNKSCSVSYHNDLARQ